MNDSIFTSSLSFVTHYWENIDEQIQRTENELNKHVDHFKQRKTSKSQIPTIDFSVILKALVRKGQHRLNAEVQCKKRLHHFDCQAHQLKKAFFDLKPTKTQVCY